MTQKEFWEHIQKTRRRDPDDHAERLVARLAKLRVVEIVDFSHWWDRAIREAYNWNLWGAAYLINGGCSDDGFHYFCCWLILQGGDVFKKAVKKPDWLAEVVTPDTFTEGRSSLAFEAWFAATGLPENEKGYDALDAARQACHGERESMPDLNDTWDHDDDVEMQKRFPRLWALSMEGDGEE